MADAGISKVMKSYSQQAEKMALRGGIVLDYSEKSLEQIDFILNEIAGDGVVSPMVTEQADHIWMLSKIYGAYLGEVVLRVLGGDWEMQANPEGAARVALRCEDVQMFPLEKVHKRLAGDPFSGVSGYCRALRAIIERQGKNS